MSVARRHRFEQLLPPRMRRRRRSAMATLNPWIFLGAAGLGATLYLVGRELIARRLGGIEVEVDLDDTHEDTDLDLDSAGPDVLDEAWKPSDGFEAFPGRR